MAKVTGASLAPIFERLNSASGYHPFEADTFADWSMEAGDVVAVSRGDETYESPVHYTRMVWSGAPKTEVNSTGNRERDAVARVSKEKYRRSGAGRRNEELIFKEFYSEDGYLHSYVMMTASSLVTHFDDELEDVHSEILQTANQIRSEVHAANSQVYSYVDQTATYINSVVENKISKVGSDILQTANQIRAEVHAANSQVYSYVDQTATYIQSTVNDELEDMGSTILQTASQIRSEVHASNSQLYSYVDQTATYINQVVANTASGLQSSIDQEAGRISLVVSGTGSNAKIKPASIVASINESGSSVVLDADKVRISGDTTINDAFTVIDGAVGTRSGVPFICQGNLNVSSNRELNVYTINLQGTSPVTLDALTMEEVVIKAAVSGNTLQLWKMGDDVTGDPSITFSKATSLSGAWSGDNFTVSASPQSQNYTIGFGGLYGTHQKDMLITTGSASLNGTYINIPVEIREMTSASESSSILRISRNTSADISSLLDDSYDGSTAAKKITSSNTYTPEQGKIGFSQVVVDITPYSSARVTGSWTNNVFTYQRTTSGSKTSDSITVVPIFDSYSQSGSTYYRIAMNSTDSGGSNTTITSGSTTFKLGTSGSTTSTKVQIQNSSGTKLSNTPELSVGSLYTDGQTAAGLTYDTSTHKVSRSLSSSTKEYTIGCSAGTPSYSSTSHKYNYTASATIGSAAINTATGSTGTEAYDAGVTAGGTAAGLTYNTSTHKVSRSTSSSTKEYTIGVSTSLTYSSTSHKYNYTSNATIGSAAINSTTGSTGTEAYDAGVTAGGTAAGLTYNTSTHKVSRSTSSSTKEYTIGVSTSLTYSSTSHKYNYTSNATIGSAAINSTTGSTGTEAYDAGKTQGWYDYFWAGSDYWDGFWLGDGTHKSTSGKHYVTGPTETYKNGWQIFYCYEDIASANGYCFSNKKRYMYQVYEADVDPSSSSSAVYYGKLYNSRGSAIYSGNYYWYTSTSNLGQNMYVYVP